MEKHRVSCICYLSKTHLVRDFLQIYHAGTILQLQIIMEDRFENDPRRIREWSENDPTTPETISHPSHRRGRSSRFGDRLCMEKHRVSCICYLSKTHLVRDFLQIYNAGTILQLQITMEYRFENDSRMIREWSENDPTTPETVSHPSHRRGRSSRFGDRLCMEKHRVSCICYLSKTHLVRDFLQIYNAGTILQLQIIMEDRFENDPRRIREWSENDPTTPETVSHPSHRRDRSSRFGGRLCMEKQRVSCICYLSKMHLVRDFLQIYNAGTILQLQITNSLSLTNSFFDYLFLWLPLSLTTSFFDWLFPWLTVSLTTSFFD